MLAALMMMVTMMRYLLDAPQLLQSVAVEVSGARSPVAEGVGSSTRTCQYHVGCQRSRGMWGKRDLCLHRDGRVIW